MELRAIIVSPLSEQIASMTTTCHQCIIDASSRVGRLYELGHHPVRHVLTWVSRCLGRRSTNIHSHDPISMTVRLLGCLSIRFHGYARQTCRALTARAVVHNLMREEIAIDAEVLLAHRALVPATDAHPLDRLGLAPFVSRRHRGKHGAAGSAMTAPTGTLPRHLDPIA